MLGIKGWATKTGVVIFAIGGALLASCEMCPVDTGIGWLKFIGTLLTSLGGAMAGLGIARKVERSNDETKVDTVPTNLGNGRRM